MELYEKLIHGVKELIADKVKTSKCGGELTRLSWEDAGDFNMVMKSEMAFELGGSGHNAISGMFFTSPEAFAEDDIIVIGPDLNEIERDRSYARITFICLDDETFYSDEEAYSCLRKIEYTRYHVNPKGYMMRISTAAQREPVRISYDALAEGLDFFRVGKMFIDGYHRVSQVKAVRILFITEEDFPYEALEELTSAGEKITVSMNAIFNNLVMDCNTCNLKPVCDEVEGLRELHANKNK